VSKSADRYADVLAEFGQDLANQAEDRFYEQVAELPSAKGTPIEQLVGLALAYALRDAHWFGGEGWGEGEGWPFENVDPDEALFIKPAREGIFAWFQAPVGKYRADFLICLAHWRGGYVWGAIECDGHDHHNLTKEQAQHDRERDRYFQSQGIYILRYTGSEIWKSPLKVVVEAITLLKERAGDEAAKRWK
jgi:very-short-patch-repair endonuclease